MMICIITLRATFFQSLQKLLYVHSRFHQVQRRARVREQLREFEELQKKDPEAALKKLEELERTRAEERMTLRHRSTGQWAKNLAVRARYDKDVSVL